MGLEHFATQQSPMTISEYLKTHHQNVWIGWEIKKVYDMPIVFPFMAVVQNRENVGNV
jgi:hypothetical protein